MTNAAPPITCMPCLPACLRGSGAYLGRHAMYDVLYGLVYDCTLIMRWHQPVVL